MSILGWFVFNNNNINKFNSLFQTKVQIGLVKQNKIK